MKASERPAYYSVNEFPQLHEICQNWETMREEFAKLDAPVMNFDREGKTYQEDIENVITAFAVNKQYGWLKGWGKEGGNDSWTQYGILCYNDQVNDIFKPYLSNILPKTYEMLSKIGGIKICAFVKLKAHAMLPCHTHEEIHNEGLLQLHLPLITASEKNYAYLNVKGEFKQHICGEPIIFDGSLDHFAINESDEDRIILYLEFKAHLN
jgi:aspartyl/asparaginyl beta-hydroxylase (cupin superfamily)